MKCSECGKEMKEYTNDSLKKWYLCQNPTHNKDDEVILVLGIDNKKREEIVN